MAFQRTTKVERLTASDTDLFGRIAYAMVVVGLWKKAVRRTDDSFDFFEITGQKGQMAYRIGRMSDGGYILFNLATGVRKRGQSLREVLRNVAYVPNAS
jgi:hypothetical protein